MPKRDEDKDDFFMDDSMSMQAESPNVLYYIYIYIMGQRVAYGRGPSHGRSEKHETHVLKDPSPQMNCDVVLITGSSTAFSFTGAQHPGAPGRGPSHGQSSRCATPAKNSAQLLGNRPHCGTPPPPASNPQLESVNAQHH